MIISQTPYRVSFFGGGTDYPAWYREHGGSVLATTINHYCYISCRILPPFFEHKHRIVYSFIECVREIDEIKHPSVRACLSEMAVDLGLEIHHDGDLPARSGIGSSSSFTVGLLNVLHAIQGKMTSKYELASQAIHIEQKVIGEVVGSQDQVAAAYGGLNHIEFHTDDTFSVKPVILNRERKEDFENHLIMFFTGLSRYSSEIAATKVANFKSRVDHLREMSAMVNESISLLTSPSSPFKSLGGLLNEGWKLKRELSDSVSNPRIDEIYEAGRAAGAYGGKILGAGGGGFILFFAPPDSHDTIRESLKDLLEVKFSLDHHGSRVIMYDPHFGRN